MTLEQVPILEDINISVQANEVVAIVRNFFAYTIPHDAGAKI